MMSDKPVAIVWFRQDLRLADNPALHHALTHFDVVPVYLYCPGEQGKWSPGEASGWWLYHSLGEFRKSLRDIGGELIIRKGESSGTLLDTIVEEAGARAVFWNRLYTPSEHQRDRDIKQKLRNRGIEAESFNGSLIHEPWAIKKPDGTPYRVFTAWWKKMVETGLFEHEPLPAANNINFLLKHLESTAIEQLDLLPALDWHKKFHQYWKPGETSALRQLEHAMNHVIDDYATSRDRPDLNGTSRLSPHLHFGEISPGQLLKELGRHTREQIEAKGKSSAERFAAELGWRDFAAHLLFHFPETVDQPLNRQFARFPWAKNYREKLSAWQAGRTGIPIVDAGMRELWHTGWMHNRVRMIVASFLTKNLLIPWQEGAAWFLDTLVDADLASNTMGWQWVAGCGADAAPYFRIFNPVLQGEKFDPDGSYVRRWVPELSDVPARYIHQPWNHPSTAIPAGNDIYTSPIVDLKKSREAALSAYKKSSR